MKIPTIDSLDLRRTLPPEQSIQTIPKQADERSRFVMTGDAFDLKFWGGIVPVTSSGANVNEETALKYLTYYSCVTLIAGDVGRIPLVLFRRSPDGSRTRATDHPLYDILHIAPNEFMTAFNFKEMAQGHLLTWGNHYAVIERKPYTDEIYALRPIVTPGEVRLEKLANNRLYYTWTGEDGKQIRKHKKDVLHIPGFGFDGITGKSPVKMAMEAIGLGLAAESFGGRFFGSGTHPSGVFELDGNLGDEENAKQFAKALSEQYAGLGNSHRVMILENGMKYKPLVMPLEDAQFLQTREFQKIEICGMFRVPPHKIAIHGSNSNYNNLEQENASYVDSCLMPWLVRWEQNLSLQLLSKEDRQAGYYFEFLVNGLLRSDTQARAEYYRALHQMGYPLNRILQKENENPVEGGDDGYIQVNMMPMDMIRDYFLQTKEKTDGNGTQDVSDSGNADQGQR